MDRDENKDAIQKDKELRNVKLEDRTVVDCEAGGKNVGGGGRKQREGY